MGLLGCGTVGSALLDLLRDEGPTIARRTGLHLTTTRVAVRDVARPRRTPIPPEVLTTDPQQVVGADDVDVVVEVMGGVEPARQLVLDALTAGKPVITANKELLANVGVELFGEADAAGVDLLFEAAVAGGIPIVRPLRESLVAEQVSRVMGIVNGTTNYILTKMTEEQWTYAEALAEAQSLGYAERDPTADVDGADAGAKAAIIATIAFGVKVVAGDVYSEGIAGITPTDVEFATRLGYVLKLLAIAERFDDGTVAVRVHPAMVPQAHPLASVRDSFNAVFVEGGAVGDLMFYGRGAGGMPTASAVLGDVVDAAANLAKDTHASIGTFARGEMRSVDELRSPYYVNVEVRDRHGVLAAVAGVFGDHAVSIHSMEQESLPDDEGEPTDSARLIFITHSAREADVRATLHELRGLDAVLSIGSVLRVVEAD